MIRSIYQSAKQSEAAQIKAECKIHGKNQKINTDKYFELENYNFLVMNRSMSCYFQVGDKQLKPLGTSRSKIS